MEFEHRVDKDTGAVRSRYVLGNCKKMYHLAESIDKNKESIVFAIVFGKSEDEVYRYGLPTLPEVVEVVEVHGLKD